MLNGQVKTSSGRGGRGRRKTGLRFSSRKTITRNRLQKEIKLRESEVVRGCLREDSLQKGCQTIEESGGAGDRASAIDITSLLSTVKELRFESSASEGEGSGKLHWVPEQVCH